MHRSQFKWNLVATHCALQHDFPFVGGGAQHGPIGLTHPLVRDTHLTFAHLVNQAMASSALL